MSERRDSTQRLVVFAAYIGVGGWIGLLALSIWWLVQPSGLPDIDQPIKVLNANHEVAIGDPLVLELVVDKRVERVPTFSNRVIECVSGNLLTLVSNPVPLPTGQYTIVSDTIVIPPKAIPGDVCNAVFLVGYEVNPVRDEVGRYVSESFTILPEGGMAAATHG